LALEKLSFTEKKGELREMGNAQYARMLSSFAYSSIILMIKSRAFRLGVHVSEVNPAYTSVIGQVKFAQRYGFSTHESAALVIGRRSLGNSERLPRHQSIVPDGKGGHVTLPLPARNRSRHVWASWRKVRPVLLKWCLQHISGRKKAILKSDLLACCDTKVPDLVGEIPTRELTVRRRRTESMVNKLCV
jgi:IS605 OrfB family transposase